MLERGLDFSNCDELVRRFEQVLEHPVKGTAKKYYTGVDLGTACVVLAVLDENLQPVAGAYQYADVVRDGMVVDYIGAVDIVKKLKAQIEENLETELIDAAAAIPPGTDELDSGAIKNVVQGAGFQLKRVLDEPTAANEVLQIENGAVVDIGGGTTGISVFQDGKVIFVTDEPTGGTHFSLVLSGAYAKSFEEMEQYKRNPENHEEILPVLKPVVEKISSIISQNIGDYPVKQLSLVGGTSCLTGIEKIIEDNTGVATYKPKKPMFVTPLGIAISCGDQWEAK